MLQPGQRFDDYRIINFFEGGGMGEIYLAEEVALGRQVIIKVVRPEALKYPESEEARKVTQLFRREATAIARLNHPYILPLYRFGESTIDTHPLIYMVMPYCQEKSLTHWMNAHGKTILSPQEVEHLLRQAAEALQYAHEQGMIHLDVKPTNFLVRYSAEAADKLTLQLADFGVAKFTATIGMSQTVRGSLEYMAPEQWKGQPVFASDQYALAIMVYKLLTGQPPFGGSGFEHLWHQHQHIQPQPPSAINPRLPPSIDGVLLRALAKNPNDRFPSILAFADAYRQALETQDGKTEYAPVHQVLLLSPEEASRGITRTIVLPTGEQLPVTVPPGAYGGQVIRIPRQNAPAAIITIQIPTVPVPPPPPMPRKSGNRLKVLLVVLAAILVLATAVVAWPHLGPQPVISVTSKYHVGSIPADSATGIGFHVNGQKFSAHSAITFLLDGTPIPGNTTVQSDANGKVSADLTITDAWTMGSHTLTARDASNHTTQSGVAVVIVPPGQAHTPGPNGAPPDDMKFTLNITIRGTDTATGTASTETHTLIVTGQPDPAGGTVCQSRDDGQAHVLTGADNGVPYRETLVWLCSGTYKGGKLTYTETATGDRADYSNGLSCVANTPYVSEHLEGTFSNQNTISGTYRADAVTGVCNIVPAGPYGPFTGSWTVQITM